MRHNTHMCALVKPPLSNVDTSIGGGVASVAVAAAAVAAASPAAAVTGLWVMSVTYLGWPIHFLASVLCFLCSELLLRLGHATKRLGKGLAVRGQENNDGEKSARSGARRFVVRLENLPQVGWV